MLAATPEQRAEVTYRSALDAANLGHPQVAAERAFEAMKQSSRHRAARQLAAVLLHAQGATVRAVALLDDGLAIDPGHSALDLLLARLRLDQESADVARSHRTA